MSTTKRQNLSVWTKSGYGCGSAAEGIAYDWVTGFFIYFLTDFAGIPPALAGTIILIAVLWDGITDPLIGYFSDKSYAKRKSRRPFILGSAVPMVLAMVFLFKPVEFGTIGNFIYYLFFAILFWTGYTGFNIPYYAAGVTLSYNETERTTIRSYSTGFMYAGALLATFFPIMMIAILTERGMDEGKSWDVVSTMLAVICAAFALITWRAMKGKEIAVETEVEHEEFRLRDIITILKPWSIRVIFIISFLFYIFYTISTSSIMYFVESNLGMGEWEASFVYLTNSVAGMIVAVVLSMLAHKYDKKYLFLYAALIGGIAQIVAKFIGINSLMDACILEVFITIGNASFWLFTFAYIYDATEIEEFRSGARREGVLVAYQSFIMKLGGALGGWMVGIILATSGYVGSLYDELEQTPEAMDAIESMFTIYPGIIMTLSAFFILILPITKKRYAALTAALELKRKKQPYSTEEFKKLL